MAVELATAYVSLVPSARGIQAQVAKELGAPTAAVAGSAGAAASGAFAARFGARLTQVGKVMTLGITAPLVAIGAIAIKSAVNFESAFADVRKTVEGTEAQLGALREGILQMAREVPASRESIAGVAAAAGQLGIELPNILGFTRVMIDLGNATNLSGDQAATALARLANITQMPQTEFDRLGSTVVALGNNLATTEAEIVEMGLRLAGAGKQVGLSQAEILGFAGALSSVGIAADAGGTAVSRVMVEIANAVATGGDAVAGFAKVAGVSADEFSRAYKRDAAGAIVTFIEGLRRVSDEGGNVFAVLDDLGLGEVRVRDALLRASGAGDLFRQSLQLGTQAWKENTALTEEANQRYATTESRLKVAANRATDKARALGEHLAPMLLVAVDAAAPLVDIIGKLVDWFGLLPSPVQKIIIGFAAFLAVLGPVLLIAGAIFTAISTLVPVFAVLGAVIGAVLSPIGLLVAAAVVLGVVIYKNWSTIRRVTLAAWNAVKDAIGTALDFIKGVVGVAIDFIKKNWDLLLPIFFGPLGLIILVVRRFGDDILGFFKALGPKLVDGLKALPGLLLKVFAMAFDGLLTATIELPLRLVSYMIIGGITIVRGLYRGLTTAIPAVWNFFTALPGRILRFLVNAGRWLVSTGLAALRGLASGITSGAVAVWNFFRALPGRVLGFLRNAARWLVDTGRRALSGLLGGIRAGAEAVRAWFAALPGRIKGFLRDAGQWLLNAGRRAIQGLLNGFRAGWDAIAGWFGKLGSSIWGKVKSGLGPLGKFLSPKTQAGVMIGEGLGLGIVAGIRDLLPQVDRAAAELAARLMLSPAPVGPAAPRVPLGGTSRAGVLAGGRIGPAVVIENANLYDGVDIDLLERRLEFAVAGGRL